MSETITCDSLLAGALVCNQHEKGYRFSIDPILLAHFCTVKKACKVIDLGAGSGVISLVLAHSYPCSQISCFELQPKLCSLLRLNIKDNDFVGRVECVHGDVRTIRDLLLPESVDLVVCNPPYGAPLSGRLSHGEERCVARHEVAGGLADFVKGAAFVVKNRGRVAFVLPTSRLADLIAAFLSANIQPKRMQIVFSYPESAGKLVLVEGVKNGGVGLDILPPLYIYNTKNGEYSPVLKKILGTLDE